MKRNEKIKNIEFIISTRLKQKRQELEKASEQRLNEIQEKCAFHGLSNSSIFFDQVYEVRFDRIRGLVNYYLKEIYSLFKKSKLSMFKEDINLFHEEAIDLLNKEMAILTQEFTHDLTRNGFIDPQGMIVKNYVERINRDHLQLLEKVKDEMLIKNAEVEIENYGNMKSEKSAKKASKRKQISNPVQAELLINSRRRCCLCVGLNNDYTIKPIQLAHIDRDSSNSDKENLVPLCLEHHEQYDSRTSQSKGITPLEIKTYRNKWFEIASKKYPIGINQGSTDIDEANEVRKTKLDQCARAAHWRIGEILEGLNIVYSLFCLEENKFYSGDNAAYIGAKEEIKLIVEKNVEHRNQLKYRRVSKLMAQN